MVDIDVTVRRAGEVDAPALAGLAVVDRVPTADRYARRSGDVQSVFVAPESRGRRVGALLMAVVLDEARRLELEHVRVHSSPRAVPFYERNGWGHDPEWLSWAAGT